MSTTNDSYLIKLKQAGVPIKSIAAKLSMTEEQVEQRWLELIATATSFQNNGYNALAEHYNETMFKYQQLGSNFMILGATLGNPTTISEIAEWCVGSPEHIAKCLLDNFIVLPRFKKPTPEEILKVTERGAHTGN
jgi:hypothetical protein